MKPAMIFFPWKKIRKDLIGMIDLFREEELGFQPFEGSSTIGDTFLHIAEVEDLWIHSAVRKELPADIHYDLTKYPSARAIRSKLAVSHERTTLFLEGLKEPDLDWRFKTPEGGSMALYEILWHVLEHELHHRGEISLALGLLERNGLDV